MTKPLSPSEVVSKKEEQLPDEVIAAFNEMIVSNWDGHQACFRQDDVASLMAMKLGIPVGHLYAKKYLDVEDIFRKSGWIVEYDKPGYNESYPATFTFKKNQEETDAERGMKERQPASLGETK